MNHFLLILGVALGWLGTRMVPPQPIFMPEWMTRFEPAPTVEPSTQAAGFQVFLPTIQQVTPTPGPQCVTLYVSASSGSDSNPGTAGYPFKTVQHAVDLAQPCQTIALRAGTYNESVRLKSSGTAEKPITLTGFYGETAVINGGTNPAVFAYYATDRHYEYWILRDLTLRSSGTQAVMLGWWKEPYSANYNQIVHNKVYGGILVRGHHNLVESNDIDGTGNSYESLAGIEDIEEVSHHNTFRNNTIHDITTLYGRGIWLLWRTHDDLVEGNTIYNISGRFGQCIDSDGYQNVLWRHTIRGNTATNCGAAGIQLENTFASVVENNRITNSEQGGVIVINYGGSGSATPDCQVGGESNQYGAAGDCRGLLTGNIVRQNVISNSRSVGNVVSYNAGGVTLWNNILYNGFSGLQMVGPAQFNPGWDLRGNIFAQNKYEVVFPAISSLAMDDYNLFYHPANGQVYERNNGTSADFYTLAQFQQAFSKGLHSRTGNPLFTDPATGNFRPLPGGASIDMVIDLGLRIDLDGNPRPKGAAFDAGAYEFQAGP